VPKPSNDPLCAFQQASRAFYDHHIFRIQPAEDPQAWPSIVPAREGALVEGFDFPEAVDYSLASAQYCVKVNLAHKFSQTEGD
jgi:hypothetical protein